MIRKAQPQDMDAILALWLAGNLEGNSFLPPEFYKERLDLMKIILPASTIYVQDLDGIKGFIGLSGEIISGLFVAPEFQRKELGKSLLTHAKGLNPELFVYVYPENEDAFVFFESQGFEVIEKSPNEETGLMEVLMRCGNERKVKIGRCAL